MKDINQRINGYYIPTYMEEILTHNYCPHFLRMSMVREDDVYRFSYQTDRFRRLDVGRLSTYDKLKLLRSLIILNERNRDWFISAENYLIEPELVYCLSNSVDEGCVRLLFYPDNRRLSFENKIVTFAEKLKDTKEHDESELIDRFKGVAESGDWNRTRLFLDKNILRMESGIRNKSQRTTAC